MAADMPLLSALENITDGFICMNPHWCCTYVNRAAERLLHRQREDLLGKNLWEVFPELVGSVFWKTCYEVAEMQKRRDVEDIFPATGQWFALSLSPFQAGILLSFHTTTQHDQRVQEGQRDQHLMQIQMSLMELAYDAIIVRDPTSTIISWNRGAEQLYGWSAQEAIGSVTHVLFHTRFPNSREVLDQFLATGAQWEGELIHMRKDGKEIIVESRQVVVRSADTTPIAIMEINRDITERKQRERENQEQYRTIVQTANEGIWLIDTEAKTLFINDCMAKMLGYPVEELIGYAVPEFVFPEDIPFAQERIGSNLQGTFEQFEFRFRRKNGYPLSVLACTSPVRDGRGEICGALGMFTDLTEHKRVQAQEQFLTEVSRVLSSTLDYQETLANVARLVVPQLADWFVVDLMDASGHFELVTLAHKDPEQVRWARKLRELYPVDPAAPIGAPRVVRTGQAELYSEITDELLVATARNEEELALARQIGYSSAMIVPLISRGRTVGVVTFVATESGKRYDERDLALAEEVGRQAGVALDNARLYREVRQSRDQLDIILQGVADGIIVYDSSSRIMYANEAAARITGSASIQAMLATSQPGILSRYEIIDEQGQPFPPSQLTHRRVFAGEQQAQAIIGYREVGSAQPERWSLLRSRPVFGEGGEVAMVVTIIHDITERMRLERRKDEFISMASHELKTPVTSLKGFTNVLQRRLTKQGDVQAMHYLARMDAQLDKLTGLINELLDISRMQSGKLLMRTELVDLDSLILETVETVQATTSTHQLSIEGGTGVQVLGDRERLGQVFINLLTNAIKYSPEETQVIVRLFLDDERYVRVGVQDFGIGIDPAHHEKIFERFYQVTDPEEKTYPGLGIGLYISSEILARHEGRMWVESRKGQGSTFFVALPLPGANEKARISGSER